MGGGLLSKRFIRENIIFSLILNFNESALNLKTVQVIVDKCNSKTMNIVNMKALQNDLNQVNDNAKLSIGGIPPSISSTHYYYATISVFEYEGCIRNVKINGQLRNLQLVQNAYNLAQANCDCKYLDKLTTNCINILSSVAVYEFPWWIILIIIAALLLLGKY